MGVTLREGDREYFYQALDKHFPGMKGRYHRKYGYAYEIASENAQMLTEIFQSTCAAHGIECDAEKVFAYLHEFEDRGEYEQISLF